jgi:hypothetical protein
MGHFRSMSNSWLSKGTSESVTCMNCFQRVPNIGYIDHHVGVCPHCNISCIFFSIVFDYNRLVQVIPEHCPPEFQRFIQWAHEELNELEFIMLLTAFDEIVTSEELILIKSQGFMVRVWSNRKKWVSVGRSSGLICLNCFKEVQNSAHTKSKRSCPHCRVSCMFYFIPFGLDRFVQIIPSRSPYVMQKFIKWVKQELDEPSFIRLLTSFHEIMTPDHEGY